jgi:hypothetical protein
MSTTATSLAQWKKKARLILGRTNSEPQQLAVLTIAEALIDAYLLGWSQPFGTPPRQQTRHRKLNLARRQRILDGLQRAARRKVHDGQNRAI